MPTLGELDATLLAIIADSIRSQRSWSQRIPPAIRTSLEPIVLKLSDSHAKRIANALLQPDSEDDPSVRAAADGLLAWAGRNQVIHSANAANRVSIKE
jgi:hypothetical protein